MVARPWCRRVLALVCALGMVACKPGGPGPGAVSLSVAAEAASGGLALDGVNGGLTAGVAARASGRAGGIEDARDAGAADEGRTVGTPGVAFAAGPGLEWPNAESSANSDPWLRAHHDQIAVMRPRVLVLDVQRIGKPIEGVTQRIVEAVAEGSRYHGYSDPTAPAFLQYRIAKIVDLRDPVKEYPDFWPPGPPFDVGELFTETFAPRYGFADPKQPGRFETLCELFESGTINELWIAAEAGNRNVYENQSRMQRYDANLEKIPGSFQKCTNGCYHDPKNRVNCAVTVRMQEVNKGRGQGCFTHAAGHALENMSDANPYWRENASRFFYQRLDVLFKAPFARLYDTDCFIGQAVAERKCSFPTPTKLQYDAAPGRSMTFSSFGQGCGDVHHKPNIYGPGVVAAQACENYALRNGNANQDIETLYSVPGSLADEKMAEYDARFGRDCDGGWQAYMRQSIPGLGNRAIAEDGKPMKNWWPFLFY